MVAPMNLGADESKIGSLAKCEKHLRWTYELLGIYDDLILLKNGLTGDQFYGELADYEPC